MKEQPKVGDTLVGPVFDGPTVRAYSEIGTVLTVERFNRVGDADVLWKVRVAAAPNGSHARIQGVDGCSLKEAKGDAEAKVDLLGVEEEAAATVIILKVRP